MAARIERDEVRRLIEQEHAQLVEVLPFEDYEELHLPGALRAGFSGDSRENDPPDLYRQIQCLLGSLSIWPEGEIVSQAHCVRGEVADLQTGKIRRESAGQTSADELIEIMHRWDCESTEGQQALEKPFSCLLSMEAGNIIRTTALDSCRAALRSLSAFRNQPWAWLASSCIQDATLT